MDTINNFYIYVYLDPRKPGEYKYQDILFNFEPIYIGKGKGNRDMYHLKYYCDNEILSRKLNKIKNLELEPIIMRISEGLAETTALTKETLLIENIGRLNLKTGPLCNLTNGGEGCSRLVQSIEHRQKNSIKNKKSYEERYGAETALRLKKLRSSQLKGNSYSKNLTAEGRQKISNANKKSWVEKYGIEYIKNRNNCYYIASPTLKEYIVFSNAELIEFTKFVGLPKTSLLSLTWKSANKQNYKNWTCKIIGTELEFDNHLKNMYTNALIWRNK